MKFIRIYGFRRRPSAPARFGFAFVCVIALFSQPFSRYSQAQERAFNEPDSTEAPWSVLSSAPYLADPGFNQGLYLTEAYPGPVSNSQLGKKIARLSNGDMVVAGIVPRFDGSASDPLINLLLTRYNSAGQRVVWSNPGANGYQFDQYVIFPNISNPTLFANVKDVLDIKVFGERIFVLVDHRFAGSENIDSELHVFGTDGAYIRTTTILGSSLSEYSGGMVIYGSGTFPETVSIAITASTFNGVWRPTFIRGTVNADSSITLGSPVYPNPGNYCPTNRGCILRSIARSNSVFGGSPAFYLAGTRQSNIPDDGAWDFLVMKVGTTGSPVTSFGGNGVTTVAFDNGLTNYDDANSIEVDTTGGISDEHDEIYVAGFVNRICKDGVGVAKLKDSGILDTSFGSLNSGKLIIGGANPPINGTCDQLPPFSTSATYVNDSALAGGKLALAGFTVKFNPPFCIVGQPCHEEDVDGTIAVIDTARGNIDSFRTYPYSDAINGPRTRHSGFLGIAESGNGTFTATGDVRYFQSAPGQPPGAQRFGTLRVRSDRVFASGFGEQATGDQ